MIKIPVSNKRPMFTFEQVGEYIKSAKNFYLLTHEEYQKFKRGEEAKEFYKDSYLARVVHRLKGEDVLSIVVLIQVNEDEIQAIAPQFLFMHTQYPYYGEVAFNIREETKAATK